MDDEVSLINVLNMWIWDFIVSRDDIYVSFPSNYERGQEYKTIFLSHTEFITKFRITILDDHVKLFWVFPAKDGLLMPVKINNDDELHAISPHFFDRIIKEIEEWIKQCSKPVQNANKPNQ